MGGRGFATAAALILIALVCIAVARRIEQERRALGRFPPHRKRLAIVGAVTAALLAIGVAAAILGR
jgi:hypothetical protein